MFRLALLLCGLLLLSLPATGQPEKQPYQMPAPVGWSKETIALPPSFAPEMKWKGSEELRFAPGMFKADSDSYLSYAILFWLPGDTKVDPKTMEQELLAYYKGLAKVVLKGKNQQVDLSTFAVTIKDVTPDKINKRPSGEPYTSYTGEIKWVEPFVTAKPQTLRLDIQAWYCEKHKHHCIFLCVSPHPLTANVWKTLLEIRDKTACQ